MSPSFEEPLEINILMVEDTLQDAELILRVLRKGGFKPHYKRATSASEMIEALKREAWDVVLSDYHMPGFGAPEAKNILDKHSLEIPFIIVSGAIGEETAVEMMRSGAVDFIMKDNLSRLVPVVQREFRELKSRRQKQEKYALEKKESEDKFRALANSIPTLTWMAHADGFIFWYNERWYEYTGTTSQQMEGWGWQDVHDPVVLPKVMEQWQASIRTGTPFEMEYPLKGSDGIFRWFLTRVIPVHNSAGSVTRWFGTCTDIENQKKSEQKLNDILESMGDGFWALDSNFTITRINSKHAINTGLTSADLLGKNHWEVFPEAKNPKMKSWSEFHKVMKERVSSNFVEYYAPLDLWCEVSAHPTPDGGMAVFYRDVSDVNRAANSLKESRLVLDNELQKIETVFASSPAGLAILRGSDLVFERVNPHYLEIIGHRDLIGKTFVDGLPELQEQSFPALLKGVFETGQPVHKDESVAYLTRNNQLEECYFTFSYIQLKDGQGMPYGVFIHALEITDQVKSRKRIEQLAKELAASLQARDEFLSIASHELKTPLTTIKIQSQLHKRMVINKDAKAYAKERIDHNIDKNEKMVNKLVRIVDDMLDISRIRSGKLDLSKEESDFSNIVKDTVEGMNSQFELAGYKTPSFLGEEVKGTWDTLRIEQVVRNLLTNAMKYGNKGPVSVKVKKLGDKALLSVKDSGIGISKESQVRIFQRFERAIDPNEVSGLGLGLYISQQIVEAHGGRIWVESEQNEGALFLVELPLKY